MSFPVANRIVPDGPVRPGELPGGPTAETVHVGPYATLPETYEEDPQLAAAARAAWDRPWRSRT